LKEADNLILFEAPKCVSAMFNAPLVDDDPHAGQWKFSSGVGFDPPLVPLQQRQHNKW